MGRETTQQTIDQLIAKARRYRWVGVNPEIRERTLGFYESALRLCLQHEISPSKLGIAALRKICVEGCIDNSQYERGLHWAEGENLLPHRAYLLWCHQERLEALKCYEDLIHRFTKKDMAEEGVFRAHTLLCEQGSLPPTKAPLIEFWCSRSAIDLQLSRSQDAQEAARKGLEMFPENSDLCCCLWRASMAENDSIPDPIDCLDDILGEGSWYVNTPWAMVCAAELFERIERFFEAGYLWHEFLDNYAPERNWSPELTLARNRLAELSGKDERIRRMAAGELEEPVSLIV